MQACAVDSEANIGIGEIFGESEPSTQTQIGSFAWLEARTFSHAMEMT